MAQAWKGSGRGCVRTPWAQKAAAMLGTAESHFAPRRLARGCGSWRHPGCGHRVVALGTAGLGGPGSSGGGEGSGGGGDSVLGGEGSMPSKPCGLAGVTHSTEAVPGDKALAVRTVGCRREGAALEARGPLSSQIQSRLGTGRIWSRQRGGWDRIGIGAGETPVDIRAPLGNSGIALGKMKSPRRGLGCDSWFPYL